MRGEVLTPAKLNWDLRVLGRRADGYHELRSWFVALDLHDVLRAETGSGAESALAVTGIGADDLPADGGNLVLRAERAWRESFPMRAGRVPPLRWTLHKRIPHGAGLGGGSGNAAGALALLERCAGPAGADPARLLAIAAALGSDVPFFLAHEGGAELRGGRGEVRLASAPFAPRRLAVAMPEFRLATPSVYAALGAAPFTGAEPPLPAAPGAAPGPNELEPAAHRVAPALAGWAAEVFGGFPRTMCGSGSAHFTLLEGAAAEAWGDDVRQRRLPGILRTRVLTGPALRIRMES